MPGAAAPPNRSAIVAMSSPPFTQRRLAGLFRSVRLLEGAWGSLVNFRAKGKGGEGNLRRGVVGMR